MKKLILCLVLFLPMTVMAYIPPYWMIMSRLAENHGSGIYRVDQKVIFTHGEEPLSVRERWYIKGTDELRLEVIGLGALRDKIRLSVVYTGNKKYYVDPNGVRKSAPIPREFPEHFFFFRNSKVIKPMLVSRSIVPAETLKSQVHRYSEQKPVAQEESFVKLARTGGHVAYAIKNGDRGVWIEQDHFNLLKIRFSDELEISANDYHQHSRGMWLPNERSVNFKNQQTMIRLNGVKGLSNSKNMRELFEASSLQFGKNPKLAILLPEDEIIRDFYINLR